MCRKVADIVLMFKKTEIEYIPTSITIEGIDSNGNTITILSNNSYIPDTINDNETHVYFPITMNVSISKILVTLTNSTNNEVRLNRMRVSLSSHFYNINTYSWADNISRKYLGIIYKKSHGGYLIYSYPIGDTVHLPVSGFVCTKPATIYKVMNPFGTKNIDIELNCIKRSSSIIPPQATVDRITRDQIYIKATTPDMFSVSCFREW
jgi:hypothetical protein